MFIVPESLGIMECWNVGTMAKKKIS